MKTKDTVKAFTGLQSKKQELSSKKIKINSIVRVIKSENLNGTTILKGWEGKIVGIPSHRNDMVRVEFDIITTLIPISKLEIY
jgi:hypothetical protein